MNGSHAAALDATEQQDWSAAATLWGALAADRPQDFEAQLRLAEALYFAARPAEAAPVARLAARLRPKDARPLLLLARAETTLDPEAAIAAWRAVLGLAPQTFEAWARLAELQLQRGRLAAALEALVRALGVQANHPFGLALAARVLGALPPRQRQERLKQAVPAASPDAGLALLHVAAQLDPQDLHAQALLAQALLARQAHAQALAPLRALAQANPGSPEPLAELARALRQVGHWAEAARLWRRLLHLRPKEAEAHLGLVQALRQDGRAEAALRAARQALAQLPEHPGLLREQAQCLAELGQDAVAEAAWCAALASHPHDNTLRLDHVEHLLRRHRPAEALAALEPLVGPAAGYDRASLLLLRLLQRQAAPATVLERFATAIANGPPAPADATAREVALRCGLLLLDGDRLDEAAALIEPARAAAPQERLALRAGLRLLLAQGQESAARTLAETSLAALRQHGWAWRTVLGAFNASGETEFATTLAQQADALFQDRPAEWLLIAAATEAGQLGPGLPERLARLKVTQPAERLNAARLALREGAPDLAARLLGQASPPPALAPAWQQQQRLLATACAVPGAAGVGFADRLLERLCALAAAQRPQVGWGGGPLVLVHEALAAGSAGRQIATTLRGLAEHPGPRRDLHLVCTRLTANPERRVHLAAVEEAGAEVTDLANQDPGPPGATLNPEVADLLALLGPGLARPVRRLYGTFRRLRPAVVHLWQDGSSLAGLLAAVLAGVPRILLASHSTRPPAAAPGNAALALALRHLAALPRLVLANSSATGAADHADWLGLPPGRVAVLRHGFDFNNLVRRATPARAAAIRAERQIPPQAPVVGGVLRLAEVTRPLLWLAAAAGVARSRPDAHFVMLGEGPLRPTILAEAQRLGLADRLHLPGRTDMAAWLRVMDVALLTSRAEGLPHVLLEAQALGRPVLAVGVGGVAEAMLPGVTGHVVPAEAEDLPAALATQLLAMLADPAWMERAGQEGRRFVGARFSAAALVQRTLEFYGLAETLAEAALPGWEPPAGEAEREAAAAAMQRQDWPAAQAGWDRLLALLPTDEEALLGAARCRLQRNLLAEARQAYAHALRLAPGQEALRGLARTLRAQHEDREALPLWEALLKAEPRDRDALLRLAETRARLGDMAGALAAAEHARQVLGQDAQAIRLQARLQTEADNPAEALRHWNTLAEALPRDGEAQLQAGLAAQALGQAALAEQRLRAALAAPNLLPHAAAALVGLLHGAGRPAEARAMLRLGLRQAPQEAALWRAGYAMLRAGGRAAAVQRSLGRLRRHAGAAPQARLALAERLLAAGQPLAAQAEWTALLETPALASAAADRLARIALGLADMTSAAAALGHGPPVSAATRQEVALASRFAARLRAESGEADPRLGYWTLVLRAAQRRGHPRYLPQRGSVLHLVSARPADVAAGAALALAAAAQGQAAGLLRLAAAPPLATLSQAGVAQANLVDHAAAAPAALAGLPELAVPGGLFGEALRPAEAGRVAAALLALKPARLVLCSWPEAAAATLAALALGVPEVVLRLSGPPPGEGPGEAALLHQQALRPVLATLLRAGSARLLHPDAAQRAAWLAWLNLGDTEVALEPAP